MRSISFRKVILACVIGAVGFGLLVALYLVSLTGSLPQMISVQDYKPLLVSDVHARGGEKIGEFTRERRKIVPIEKIPPLFVQAFTAAEDDQFFQHHGINYVAIMRAALANLRSGRKAQGASTITQQIARSLLLTREKTFDRKIREVLLAYRMEQHLSKEQILYLYLNEIYFGAGAYGIAAAAETYFRKTVDQVTLPEVAILAGLPQAPSDFAPTNSPSSAKDRQRYVLRRMRDVGHITEETYQKALETPVQFYVEGPNKEEAQYFVEIVRQMLVAKLGEAAVLDGGLRIDTALDLKAQREANQQVRNGLHEVDKRQGYRGPLRRLTDPKEQDDFLLKTRNRLKAQASPTRVLLPDGSVEPDRPLEIYHKKDAQGRIVGNIPPYVTKELLIEALVTRVDDGLGLVHVRFADAQGLIDISDMAWARKPDPAVNFDVAPKITKPSAVLKTGDVILIRVVSERFVSPRFSRPLMDPNTKKPMVLPSFAEFAQVALEQEPLVQGALLSFDLKTQDIIAMVGGYDFQKDKFNRSIQANRQTGSSFKTIVYAAALDKGFTAATPIQDAPVVYDSEAAEGQEADERKWKPHNHGEKFAGDILFRTALVRSLNIPTVKILEQVGVGWVIDYGRRLGLFSQLNNDLSLGLGSSSVTLYEMTKVFAHFARLGQRIQPVLVRKVTDPSGRVLVENISLDLRFQNEIGPIEQSFEQRRTEFLEKESSGSSADSGGQNLMENALAADGGSVPATPTPDPKLNKTPRIFFSDPERMMSAQTAYVMTSLLQGTITDEGGTAARARALGRPAAGKTGTTNGYFDAWFIGYTPQISTGVWVGFNEEKSLGAGEVGGRSALPIWLDYMLGVHKDLPTQAFPIPSGIVFANIDSQTGELASASSKGVINQAFVSGTEPSKVSGAPSSRDEGDFFKDDLAQ